MKNGKKHRETTISQIIGSAREQADYDAAARNLIGLKEVLARILQAVLSEYQNSSSQEIAEKYIENVRNASVPVFQDVQEARVQGIDSADKSIQEGTVLFDLLFEASLPKGSTDLGMLVNIEVQRQYLSVIELVRHGVYYGGRMLSLQKGRYFQKTDYKSLRKVCSVWIVLNPPKELRNTVIRLDPKQTSLIGNARLDPVVYDRNSLVLINLGGPEDKNYTGIVRFLSVLLSERFTVEETMSLS